MTIEKNRHPFRFTRNNPYKPELNPRHSFAAKFAMQLYEKRAIYSVIPKNACSTLRYSLGIENGFLTQDSHPRWIHDNLYTFSASQQALIEADYSFVVLRCPFSRLVSCYMDKIVGGHADVWDLLPLFVTDEDPQSITFRRFVEILDQASIFRANMHWQPQTDFLVYSNYSDFFALERFDDAIKVLKEKIDFDVYETRSTLGHDRHKLKTVNGRFSDVPAHEMAAMKRGGEYPDGQAMFDPDIYDQVASRYSKDLAIYKEKTGLPFTVDRA